MYPYQTDDRELFMANRPPGTLVRVVRMPSTHRVRRGDRFVTVPAIEFTYSYVREGRYWVYEEKRAGETNPAVIDIRDTLWAELENTGDYWVAHCSGSV